MNKIIAITLFTVASCMDQREEYLAKQREKFNCHRQQEAQNVNNESNEVPNLNRNDSININAVNDVLDRSHSDQAENQNNAVENVQSHDQLINEDIVNVNDQEQQPQYIPPINEGVYREGMLFDNNQIHFNNADHSDNIYNVNDDDEQDNMDDELLQRAIQDSLSINNPNHIINDQNVHNVHDQINQNDESERVRNFNNPDYLDFNNPDYLASDVEYQRILHESANVNNVHNINNVQDVNNAHNQNNQEEQDLERALLESLNHDNDVDVQLQQALLESNLNNAHGSANLNNAYGSANLNNAYGSDNLNNAYVPEYPEDEDLDMQKAIEESNLYNFR